MTLQLDPDTTGALHERIAATVRRTVADGELAPGARLPTARELAEQFDVNVNTVLRAYRQLASDGILDLRRGRGAVVTGQPNLARLYELADALLDEAARLGISRGELAALLATRS